MSNFSIKKLKEIKDVDIYIYGGFVRDLLLNRSPNDVDLKIIINSSSKKKKRHEILDVLVQYSNDIKIVRLSNNGILYRSESLSLDLVIYPNKCNRVIYKTNYVINSLNINLSNGKYIFDKGYLKSLIQRKLIINLDVPNQKGINILTAFYLLNKLPNFSFSNETLNFINLNIKSVKHTFMDYLLTEDIILKNELEKIIFISNKNHLLIQKQLEVFLSTDIKKDRETLFLDRLNRLRIYAKMQHEL